MAAVTSLIFIGQSHPNQGGIRPTQIIRFEEGDRPAFIFEPHSVDKKLDRLVVIPTVENLLDDLLLLAAYRLKLSAKLPGLMDEFIKPKISEGYIDISSSLTRQQREHLYNFIKDIESFPKMAFCVFEGSGLIPSIAMLRNYPVECEVCLPAFSRRFSSWTNTWEISDNFSQFVKTS